MEVVDLIIHAYVFVILLLAYLVVHRAQSHRKRDTSAVTKDFVVSSPQLKQALDDVERASEISDKSLLLLVNLKEQVNEALTDIADMKLSLKSVQESTQRFDRILFDPQAKGALGEKFVADQLALLPQGWVRQLVGVVAVLGLFLSSFR